MLPLSPNKIAEIFRDARGMQQRGDLDDARRLYQQIVNTNPKVPEVWFQLGQINIAQGDLFDACSALDRAAKLKPKEVAIWKMYAEAVYRTEDPKRANAFLRDAKAAGVPANLLSQLQSGLKPKAKKSKAALGNASPADIKKAIGLLQAGRFPQAEELAQRLRKAHPSVAIIADILANAQAATGKFEEAEVNFRAAMSLDPGYGETRANFGRFLLETGRSNEATRVLRTALELTPNAVALISDLGVALAKSGQNQQAEAFLSRALRLDPGRVEPRLALARAFLNEGRAEEAIEHLEIIRNKDIRDAEHLCLLGRAYGMSGRVEQAESTFALAKERAPASELPLTSRALFLNSLGKFDEAVALYREALLVRPSEPGIYQAMVTGYKVPVGDPVIDEMKQAWDSADLSAAGRAHLGFALAKALEDTGAHDQVFEYLRPANDAVRELRPFDINQRADQLSALREAFEDFDFSAAEPQQASDFRAIFVTGLPRSGTTLVEQIIASHSEVTGAGELGFARQEWDAALEQPGDKLRKLSELSMQQISAVGQKVAERMQPLAGSAGWVTDKGVQNYLMLGAVKVSMPNAKFVIVQRDPRDNLLSIYKNFFAEGQHLYSYSLRDLGLYYRQYLEMIAFWRRKVPGWFHELQYEELVADTETQTRSLIAACGLDWQDQCLEFHRNKRQVTTLSLQQVRQPIYSTSMKSWQRYEDELGELFEALGPEFAGMGT